MFDVFTFADEWSHISNHFSDKFCPSFESGNSRLITAKAHRYFLTTNVCGKKTKKCPSLPKKVGEPTCVQQMSVLYILFWLLSVCWVYSSAEDCVPCVFISCRTCIRLFLVFQWWPIECVWLGLHSETCALQSTLVLVHFYWEDGCHVSAITNERVRTRRPLG